MPGRNSRPGRQTLLQPSIYDDLKEQIERKGQTDFIGKLTDMRHLSPLEHVTFTFGVEGISRSCSHQIVRHR